MKDIYLMNKETGELVPSADVFATYEYTSYLSSPFDEWADGLEMSNPNEFPCAYVIPKSTSEVGPFPKNAFVCSGSCDSCTDETHHCWTMKIGDSVAFPEH